MSIRHKLDVPYWKGFEMRGDRLKLCREKFQISQADLAAALNMSEIQILRYEKGAAAPRADVVTKLAEFFNVTADYLLGLSEDPGGYGNRDLTSYEMRIIAAIRRDDLIEAIRIIISKG
jgi:transcriptional regulator with XRE-family HTH domain